MFGFGNSPQETLAAPLLAMTLAAFLMSGLMRWRGVVLATDFLMPVSLLAAYWLVYNKVPAWPPVGAVNKLFYVIAVGALVGLTAEIVAPRSVRILALVQPVAAAFYIGQPRLGVATWEVLVAATVGIFLMWCLLPGAAGREDDVKRGGVGSALALGFAPIALLGASSSSFQLCLMFAASSFGILVVHGVRPAFRFGGVSSIGALGGLIAIAFTVVLITRKTDLIAVSVLILSVVLPMFSDRICRATGLSKPFPLLFVHVLLAALPAALAVVVAFLDYGSSFPV
ncbi:MULTISPECIES: hypothetical protein [Rhizobium]|uniref:Uncharacterized protein n=1 Tax=Rhizobium paranaense TaxID=1650438 RepID=A0A7W8XXH4_9HYPH|nr:hypothetical protein [Rhizobium paranaense]MBB5577403.1 hypothetical protein [Rhizobium paranaense]